MSKMDDKPKYSFAAYSEDVEAFTRYPNAGDRDAWSINYCAVGLGGEIGELLNDWKKAIRDEKVGQQRRRPGVERRDKLLDELADVLWYAVRLEHGLGSDLETVAQENVRKLETRAMMRASAGNVADKEICRLRGLK